MNDDFVSILAAIGQALLANIILLIEKVITYLSYYFVSFIYLKLNIVCKNRLSLYQEKLVFAVKTKYFSLIKFIQASLSQGQL